MARRKLTVVEEGFILHNHGKMSTKDMAKQLDGIGAKTVQNFIEKNCKESDTRDVAERQQEVRPIQIEILPPPKKEERKPNPVKMPKRKSLAGRDENKRSVVMTEAESGQGDEFKKALPRNQIDLSKVFIPNPKKKSF